MFEITDEFLTHAGFDKLTGDIKEQLRSRVASDVEDRIKRKVVVAVGEQRLAEFAQLLDSDEVAAVVDWCQKSGVDLAQIVQGAMSEVMADLQQLNRDALDQVQS